MKRMILRFLPAVDLLLVPFVFFSAWLLKILRRTGFQRLPNCKNVLMKIGVFPIRKHYYEPQFDHRNPKRPLSQDRNLPGIDWNAREQLEMLSKLSFAQELFNIPQQKTAGTLDFNFNNINFKSGDAEYWYQLIRLVKPKRIYEVGSGHSTLMAIKAIRRNRENDADYICKHVCIEPYEMPWLENIGVSVVRKRIEDVELSFFAELEENDVLFIDSSHIIKPQGDVLFEYLEILPTLKQGVIVHVHDIFSPKNYLKQWLEDEVKFWNEQYLLEAYLSHNNSWKIIGALNYLHHNHYEKLKLVAPFLTPDREPGSFYMQKIT
jgi:hypothetical protein